MKASLWAFALVVAAIALAFMPVAAMGQDSLGLGDNVSVQVTRANQTDTSGNSTNGGTTAQPSGCLIATAAFGSELTPQVQFLRGFRDNHILSTAAGASFMSVFNSAYYSFSPQVADYEREQPWLQAAVKAAVYPLFGILTVAEKGYSMSEGEGGAILAGFAASSLIGAVYLSPAAIALRKKAPGRKLLVALGIVLAGSLALVAVGVMAEISSILMASTALFVMASAGVGLYAVMALARFVEKKKPTL
jgi:peptide/nickel transport system substrate-binding protein